MIKKRGMRRSILIIALALLCFAGVFPMLPVLGDTQPPDHAHRLGMKVKCMCGGCNDSAGGCYHIGGAFSGPCDRALSMLKTIDERLAKGDSDDLILQSFVQEFGPAALIEPPHSGFAGMAWWIPSLAFAAGLAVVLAVISRWRRRGKPQPALATATGASGGGAISQDLLERARARAARDTED